MQNPKHIVITGASSGIGAAMARAYAAPGITLGLIARRAPLLAELAQTCRAKGAQVWVESADVTSRDAMREILQRHDDELPVDLLVANAGISGGTFGGGESETQARAIFATNLEGVLNSLHPLLPRMKQRRSGQIAIMASLAGFRGFPSAPAYCASKAAVRLYGEGLRVESAPFGVEVNVICPGYIETPMTDVNDFPMPFLMKVEQGAAIIMEGLRKNRARIAFPWPMAAMVWLLAALPPSWVDPLLQKLPKKASWTLKNS